MHTYSESLCILFGLPEGFLTLQDPLSPSLLLSDTQVIQLATEYDPRPPSNLQAGQPATAPPQIVQRVRDLGQNLFQKRQEQLAVFAAERRQGV